MFMETVFALVFASVLVFVLTSVSQMSLGLATAGKASSEADSLAHAARRVSMDIENAARDSVRVATDAAGRKYVEFATVTGIGVFQSSTPSSTALASCPSDDAGISQQANDRLELSRQDSCFKTVGAGGLQKASVGDWLALPGGGAADFYQRAASNGGPRAKVTGLTIGTGEARVAFDPATLAAAPPSNSFLTVMDPATWICDPTAGTLTRVSGYGWSQAQKTTELLVQSVGSRYSLDASVTGCDMSFNTSARTALRLPFDGSLSDAASGISVSPFGSAAASGDPKFGTGSLSLDGSSYASISGSQALALGTGDFTVSAWLKPTANGTRVIIGGGAGKFALFLDGQALAAAVWGSSVIAEGGSVPAGAWTHVAVTRSSGTLRLFVNGSLVASAAYPSAVDLSAGASVGYASGAGYAGLIDDLVVDQGLARWTAQFDVPASALGQANTGLTGWLTGKGGSVGLRAEPRTGTN